MSDPRVALREAGLRPKKSFGQNFLVAANVAEQIARACVPDPNLGQATVVEIGAGTGALTALLGERARKVIAIERDRDLVPLLAARFAGSNVEIVEGDAQTTDYAALFRKLQSLGYRGDVVVEVSGMIFKKPGYDPRIAAQKSYTALKSGLEKAGLAPKA